MPVVLSWSVSRSLCLSWFFLGLEGKINPPPSPSKVDGIFSAVLSTAAVLTHSVKSQFFWQGFKLFWLIFQLLFFGFFCSCLTLQLPLLLDVSSRDASPFQLSLIDSPGSWIADEDLCSHGLSAGCAFSLSCTETRPVSYFCVVSFPLLPVFCSSTQQPCTLRNGTARCWHGQNMPFSDTRVRARSHRHTLVSFSEERLVTDHTVFQILIVKPF